MVMPEGFIGGLRAGGVSEEARREVLASLWTSMGGAGPPREFPYLAGGMLGVLLLLLLLQGKLSLSRGCVRCGRPACRRCNAELKDDSVCGQCFHAFIHKEQVDAKVRLSKEIEVRQFKRRRESIARAITFVLPGAGQLIKDRPLRGALVLAVVCCVGVELLASDGVMRSPMALAAGTPWLKLIPLAVLGGAAYAWAIVDVFRSEN
jgi:hypothetical protein